ncbi:MAG: TIGR01212 family radical SAM protein [Acidobacteriota bacterium]
MTPIRRYSSYGDWLRQRFGVRVHKVSVDGGFTCPNRDGAVAWGGCTYCNNDSFRGYSTGPAVPVETQVREGIQYLVRRFHAERFLVYWQNYTSTYAPVGELERKFRGALEVDARIAGMTVGTRPDCIEDEKLEMLREVAAGRYLCIELGMESTSDDTLRRINRGHDFACFLDAARRIRNAGIDLCVHLIIGFPWEDRDQWLTYPAVLREVGARFVKFHHLHVVRGTRLALDFQRSPFPVFGEREWVAMVCDLLERLDRGIVVQRLFGWAPAAELIAPRWGWSRARMLAEIERELERRGTWQGCLEQGRSEGQTPPWVLEG